MNLFTRWTCVPARPERDVGKPTTISHAPYSSTNRTTSPTADGDRVRSIAPGTALALLAQGRRASLSRKFDRAIELYDQAIEKDPGLLDAYLARAEARLFQTNYAGALRDANEATDSNPNSSRALTLRAHARFHANNDRMGALADLEHDG